MSKQHENRTEYLENFLNTLQKGNLECVSSKGTLKITLNSSYEDGIDTFNKILKKCIHTSQDIECNLNSYEIDELFSRWLDMRIFGLPLISLRKSLMQCGVETLEDTSRSDIINSLIKYGIAPHLISRQIYTVIENLTNEEEDNECSVVIKALYCSSIIGECKINKDDSQDQSIGSNININIFTDTLNSIEEDNI
ncbi:MAG: hypothetical protein KAH32_00830 [Chlamydiia bacterium]|nr:hypothetical protein [Chlamydiia bacterium]